MTATNAQALTLERIFSDPDLNGSAPVALRFSPDGSRVSYLKPSAGDFERLDLWEYHIQDATARMLVDSSTLMDSGKLLSDEEKARRERLRIFQTGIVEYFWSPDGSALLFPLNGDLWLYRLDTDEPLVQLTRSDTFETDIQFSPDGQHIAFVREQNLFVIELAGGTETQLTSDGSGTLSNGLPEFIAQEEMHRYEGYWWSPDSTRIAYLQVDEAPVEISQRYEIDADQFGVYDQRYPFAGTPNAEVRLGVIELSDTPDTSWIPLQRDPETYLPRINWFADSRHLAVQIQSRDQQNLLLCRVACDGSSQQTLLTETSATWINLHNNFRSLAATDEFIWASERTGYLHLYRVANDGSSITPLTEGDWVVTDIRGIDEQTGKIWFEGFADTPLEKHLYITDLHGSGMPQRITGAGGFHMTSLSRDRQYFIDRWSSPDQPPAVVLRSAAGEVVAELSPNTIDRSHPFYPFRDSTGGIEFGTLEAEDGQTLHYRLIKPANYDNGGKHPLIVTVYGGPGVQRVTREWIPPWHHYMAARGYALLQLDNRGTANRGKAFESPIYRQLGEAEVRDQLTGVSWATTLPWVDANRIGVFGHSYGGYMTLMLMMKAPEVFRAGVSVAPVTDWGLYDTHYTERYLGHPAENQQGYEHSNVFPWVSGLRGQLLIIHGMADDNVLFTNSTKLYKVLQDQNIQFEIMNYPGAKHGIAGKKVNLHRYTLMDNFFDRNLHL